MPTLGELAQQIADHGKADDRAFAGISAAIEKSTDELANHRKDITLQLDRILAQTISTNGRVTQLEIDRKVREALAVQEREHIAVELKKHQRLSGWVMALVIAACGSAFGSFAYLIAGH